MEKVYSEEFTQERRYRFRRQLLDTRNAVGSLGDPIQRREHLGGMLNFYHVKRLESTRSVFYTIRALKHV